MAHGMDATHNRSEQQLVREARIGLAAIGAAMLVFFGVAFWRLGPLATLNSPPPPPPSENRSSAPEPVDIATHPKRAAVRPIARPEVLHASGEPAAVPTFDRSPAAPVTYEQPIVEPPRNTNWQPPADPTTFLPNPHSLEQQPAPPIAAPSSPPVSSFEQPPSPGEIADPTLNRIPTGTDDQDKQPEFPPGVTAISPTPLEPGTMIIGPGDTFFTIARSVYNNGDYYKALYQHNRDRYRRPDRLPIGGKVLTPPVEDLHRLFPNLCPVR